MKNFKQWSIIAGGCLIAVGLTANAARAAYVTDDPRLPPPVYRSIPENSVDYDTSAGTYIIGSFFDIFTEIDRFAPPPLPPGASEVHSFFDIFTEFDLTVQSGGNVFGPVHIRESPTRASLRLNGLPPGTPYEGYNTEMESLDITGSGKSGGLPAGVMIRESPTLASLGQHRIIPLGGGQYAIDSFFDVFTELSLDGGQTWKPSSGPIHLEGALAAVPELSSCLVWLVGSVALGCYRFRRVS
jgi:hypothetical protein